MRVNQVDYIQNNKKVKPKVNACKTSKLYTK